MGTSVVIPDGEAGATLIVTPVQDSLNEGTESILLILSDGSSYTVGVPGSATVNVLDDDRSTVSIVATDPTASETAGNTGQFTVTRTSPTTGQPHRESHPHRQRDERHGLRLDLHQPVFQCRPVFPDHCGHAAEDSSTEGDEVVTLALASGSYDIGTPNFDNVTIRDNDLLPTVFISSPTAQGVLLSLDNGLLVTAEVEDDGTPQPVTVVWTQASGPGTATFDAPAQTTSGVTFSEAGSYVLRITATDGQFSVNDQIAVEVGPSLTPAGWIRQDLNPSSSRRGDTGIVNGVFTVTGTGSGYAGTSDGAHVITRQVSGNASLVARVTSLSGTGTPLTGLTIRDSMWMGSRRAVLGCEPGNVVRFRTRTTASVADSSITASAPLPLWLKLERDATTNVITAFYSADVSGSPGTWTQIGSPTAITMDADASLGLTTTSSSTSSLATGVIDQVTLTPTPNGAAVLREDETASSFATPGTSSYNPATGVHTVAGGPNGSFFHGWQYQGDFMVTARHDDATSGAGSARSGIVIRESSQNGATAWMGRIPTGSYNGFSWTPVAGGSGSGVPTFTGKLRWIRMIRKGNQVTAFHAPDVAGAPGTWLQVGQPQTVIMTPQVLVGFAVNNSSGVGLNTAKFSSFSVVPLNTAPYVEAGITARDGSTTTVGGTVTDDGRPNPPGVVTTRWNKQSGPGDVMFGDEASVTTTAETSVEGTYHLRLLADDGQARTYDEIELLPPPSVITVTASDADAGEAGDNPGAFTIARTGGDPQIALTVHWTTGGSATPDSDYAAIGGSTVIPPGQSAVIVPVSVLPDILVEGEETVTLSLADDASYLLGATTSATVTLADDDIAPTVTITSPRTATATIPSGVGLILEATIADNDEPGSLTAAWDQVAGPGPVTFGSVAQPDTTVLFPAPGSYVLRLTGSDGANTGWAIVRVKVDGPAPATPQLHGINAVRDGYGGDSNGTYTLVGAGAGLDGTADQAHLFSEIIEGDFDLRARLTAKSAMNPGAHVALTARAALDPGAAHVSLTHHQNEDTRLVARDLGDAPSHSPADMATTGEPPLWMRLQRSGTRFTASVSTDGIIWQPHEHLHAGLPGSLQVGFAASNGSTDSEAVPQIATFESVSGLSTPNLAPLVEAGALDVVLSGGSSASGASLTDDALPSSPGAIATTWSQVSGPGIVTFADPGSITSSRGFSVPGTYVLRLTADDGEVITFDESTVVATDSLYEIWTFGHFGEEFGNLALTGPSEDGDGDGLDNLLEYATDSDPRHFTGDAITFSIATIGSEHHLRVTVRRNPDATDVTIGAEAGSDLSGWSANGLVIETDTPTLWIARDTVPVGTAKRFLRVKATP
jgi:hypothetical protein